MDEMTFQDLLMIFVQFLSLTVLCHHSMLVYLANIFFTSMSLAQWTQNFIISLVIHCFMISSFLCQLMKQESF